MNSNPAPGPLLEAPLPLEQQVVRLHALLEASREVHSSIELKSVLARAARVAVLELELDGAFFTTPRIGYGEMPEGPLTDHLCVPLRARDGQLLSELVLVAADGQQISLYERDFLEGLALQTSLAVENAMHHQQRLEWARLERDLDAARAIQQSLLPQQVPVIPGYSLAARSNACYQVGGDYLDLMTEASGSQLMVIADVAGKGLASALIAAAFRSAFRALAHQPLPLDELASRLSQQHWEEGPQARGRYVTAMFARLHPATGELECVNAGHNPAVLFSAPESEPHLIAASGTPLGMLTGSSYTVERLQLHRGTRVLLYTDGLTEVFQGDEEFGEDRLFEAFRGAGCADVDGRLPADDALSKVWSTIEAFADGAPQQDDMSAIALCRHTSMTGEKA